MAGPIVTGTDGTETATTALKEAMRLAEAYGSELVIVSAYRPAGGGASGVPSEFADSMTPLSHVESVLDDAANRARTAGLKVSTRAIQGDPGDAILDVAEETGASVIVVGNKGISSAKRFVLGNVPSKIVHNARCSTFVVSTT